LSITGLQNHLSSFYGWVRNQAFHDPLSQAGAPKLWLNHNVRDPGKRSTIGDCPAKTNLCGTMVKTEAWQAPDTVDA